MVTSYRHNHYVPEWYQRRFLAVGKARFHYLDLYPEKLCNNGHTYTRSNLLHWGPKQCFAQDNLYTTNWGGLENRDIEKFFFGQVDKTGQKAVEHFANFEWNEETEFAWQNLLPYMSVQKLRTPKGLAWLRLMLGTRDGNETLIQLQNLRNIFCNIWAEAVWQIADASYSATKFIISDHPVVTYNRECFPGSKWCVGPHDPDIRLAATHTFFCFLKTKFLS
jgi:hypothetical protein